MSNPIRTRPGRLSLPLLLALAFVACGPKTPPATRPGAPPPVVATALSPRDLPAEFERIFGAPVFGRMQWAVVVQSLESGAILYERNAAKLMMPASNMKIVTLAASAERLGWDYRYQTRLVSSGTVEGGVLRGDLVVVGGGDPTINSRGGNPTRVFESWADQLRASGIERIDGRIVADATAFDAEGLGPGWAWDYLGYGYAAPVGALQYNEDVAELVVRRGPTAGAPAGVEVRPVESGLLVESHVTTTAAGSADLELRRLPGSNRVLVTGSVPAAATETLRSVTVDDPALYFVRVLRATLLAKGIAVSGEAIRLESPNGEAAAPTSSHRVLLQHQSAPLSEIARVLMKVSQNLYAETFLKTLSLPATAAPGASAEAAAAAAEPASTRGGQKVVREVLTGWGIPPDSYELADGSGLSRYNYVSAGMLATILRQMYRDPRHRDAFQATLPVGGQDGGTIAKRFKGTRAEGNVRAKTGSIANVRALSGYVTTLDGEPIVFSMIANNFTQPQETIDATTDLAVERLANMTRR